MVLRTPRREALQAWLQEQGIGTAIHYPQALPDLPAYGQAGHFPQARRHAREALSLPLYPELPPEHLEAVAQAVREWCLKNG
jgi:dTDP-4-amino-4,6-dideoxygalactose transaminase